LIFRFFRLIVRKAHAEIIAMIQTHPFGCFAPPGARCLLLGSFTAKEAFDPQTKDFYVWFYSTPRNQFWPILREVYGARLQTREEMQELFAALRMAIADIIHQCERREGSSLDANLTNIVYATEEITQVFENNPIIRIFFTSRWVEARFRRVFKDVISRHPAVELVALPSPSPRYARMTRAQKVDRYRELLPPLAADEERLRLSN
jgi:hypoxanthine-DNA glycosylase